MVKPRWGPENRSSLHCARVHMYSPMTSWSDEWHVKGRGKKKKKKKFQKNTMLRTDMWTSERRTDWRRTGFSFFLYRAIRSLWFYASSRGFTRGCAGWWVVNKKPGLIPGPLPNLFWRITLTGEEGCRTRLARFGWKLVDRAIFLFV